MTTDCVGGHFSWVDMRTVGDAGPYIGFLYMLARRLPRRFAPRNDKTVGGGSKPPPYTVC